MTNKPPLSEGQMKAFADVLATADTAFGELAMKELLATGSPLRVATTIAAMLGMAQHAFKMTEDEITGLVGLAEVTRSTLCPAIVAEGAAKNFSFNYIAEGHAFVEKMRAAAGPKQ